MAMLAGSMCYTMQRNWSLFCTLRTAARCSKNTAANPAFEKIRLLQEQFQKNDGKPVWLKGGPRDQLLYRSTLGLCALGLLLDFSFYFRYILA